MEINQRDLWNEPKCFFKIKSSIAELWTKEGWRYNFRRQFYDWEIPRMADFINKIEQFGELGADEDELQWKGDEKNTYKVSKAYMKMNHNLQPSNWPWKNIWKTKMPHKVACFVWLLAKEAMLTQENLMKRGIILCLRCFLCREQAETVNHLFLHCRITRQLWRLFLNHRGITWSILGKITEALTSWEQAGLLAKKQVEDSPSKHLVDNMEGEGF
ncbi:hypothetical protein MTR67_047446 [Solanum verrucosum]|uniref:Reverse transcriptase zinc-binding domain-containing protein n=1 Tax=Solanum verrucosum TaxID=315347 RepID=A0AAF0ZWI3_SOLVR|nr:hypothetical protein MTR67_047446 [Solanum verrucosum]